MELSHPEVMGILNMTPDSFYDGGKYTNSDLVQQRVETMLKQGARFIDVGAYSTRPGARHISEAQEGQRLFPVLRLLRDRFPSALVSVDTFRSNIAREAVESYGAAMINDISGGTADAKMFQTIAGLGVPYVLMHIQGTPQTMQRNPKYDDVVKAISGFFAQKIQELKLLGVGDVILDPGFGFGKTLEHNYELMQRLDEFQIFSQPLLVGVSRKSMIFKLLETTPDEALNGTTALNTVALLKGAGILRVHDVKQAVETIKIYRKLNEQTLRQ